MPEDETARILGENAAAVYKVDVDALANTVAEIGPTPDEVHGRVPEGAPG